MSIIATSKKAGWVSHLHVVLPHIDERKILLLPTDDGWVLPALDVEGGIWVGDAARLIPLLGERLGLAGEFTILRHLGVTYNREERWDRAYPVLEWRTPGTEPIPGGRWVGEDDLAGLPLADASQGTLLADFLAENEAPPLRAAWARRGWFVQTADWMVETLTALGRTPTGPVEQFKNLGISSVLRVPTADGLVYLKATAQLPLFINEGVLMAFLAERFPGQIPSPLAIKKEQRLMLLDDFGTSIGEEKMPLPGIEKFFRQFSNLQAQTAGMVDDLLRAGCTDRRLPVLSAQIDELGAHSITARYTRPADLARFKELIPALQERCTALAAYRLPETLAHGDLHLGNVARSGEEYQIFDWSDSCIAHPFVDLIDPYFSHTDPGTQERLRDAYLARWTEWEPMHRLLEAWALAKPLVALHQAISYLHILIGQEEVVHPEMASGLRDFIELTLRAMAEI